MPEPRKTLNHSTSSTAKGKPAPNLGSTLPRTLSQPSMRTLIEDAVATVIQPSGVVIGKSLDTAEKWDHDNMSCDPSDHLQESSGPPGPKTQQSLKKSLFGGSAKKSLKIPVFLGTFLWTHKKTLFETFFAILAPVNGRSGRKTCR